MTEVPFDLCSRVKRLTFRLRHRKVFNSIETFCLFVGYPRSGHSLVGSLLDAHPNMVIAHEADALKILYWGATRNQLFSELVRNTRDHARKGRIQTGYSYDVPGQWQGRFEKLRVIGDKKGGVSSRHLRADGRLEMLKSCLGDITLKFIHVIRNPFDNIATISKHGRTLEQAIEYYFLTCNTVVELKNRIVTSSIIDVHTEDLIADPRNSLDQLCTFLNVPATPDYLSSCAEIIYEKPKKTRGTVNWTPSMIDHVRAKCGNYSYLQRYRDEF